MKFLKILAGVLLLWSLNTAKAQLPPPEQLLPEDTFAVLTSPDWTKTLAAFKQSAYGQLWDDPSVKPFREKFEKTFGTDVKEPLQKKFGVNLQEYKSLLQGQLTFALTPPREGSDDPAGLLILLDAKSKSDALATKLGDLRKKLSESSRKSQTEKIRDTDFTVITITQAEMKQFWSKIFSKGEDEDGDADQDNGDDKDKKDLQLRIGQSKSLLIIGENPKVIEKVLARQNGGSVPVLGDQAAFQKNRAVSARDALAYGWLNWKPVYQLIMKNLSKSGEKEDAAPGMPNLKPEKIVEAVGLKAIQSFGFSISGNADGNGGEFFLAIPESERQGLFKVFNLQPKDCSPPPFVPADAVKFQRWRIDAQKAWAALEETVSKIDPSIAAMVQLGLSTAGKDKDPNFDFDFGIVAKHAAGFRNVRVSDGHIARLRR